VGGAGGELLDVLAAQGRDGDGAVAAALQAVAKLASLPVAPSKHLTSVCSSPTHTQTHTTTTTYIHTL
jgi:membrane protein involved in colicin uptake